jgi:hypothetical protein
MEPKDGKGAGEEQRTAGRKRAPSARKRTPKSVPADEQSGPAPTERETAPETVARPAQSVAAVASRSATEVREPGQRTSDEPTADVGAADERDYGEPDSARAADVAADLKSWMDARREDRDGGREVL